MIDLYSAATPGGHAVSILLEELGTPYTIRPVDLSTEEHRRSGYLRVSPSGSLPATVDWDADDFAVYRSAAILLYLAEKYNRLLSRHHQVRSKTLQWLMLKATCISSIQQQVVAFFQSQHGQPVQTFYLLQEELRRIYAALGYALTGQTFLCGEHSIADVAVFPWVHSHAWSRIDIDGLPHLKAWLEGTRTRPAVLQGLCLLPRGASITADSTLLERPPCPKPAAHSSI